MLHPFVSAQPVRVGHPGWLSISVVAHAGLIAAAVAVSPRPIVRALGGHTSAVERILFASPTSAARLRREPPRARRRLAFAAATTPTIPEPVQLPPLDLAALALPDVPLVSMADAAIDAAVDYNAAAGEVPGSDRSWLAMLARGLAAADAGDTFTEELVEKPASPRGGNPRPRYPAWLAQAHVEGSLVVRFVVDTSGRVDARSVEFPHAAHKLFVSSVRDALLHSHYFPAEFAGRRVRQLVEQRFTFVLAQ